MPTDKDGREYTIRRQPTVFRDGTRATIAVQVYTVEPSTPEWTGSQCPIAPAECWIDDATGEHVNASTGHRSTNH